MLPFKNDSGPIFVRPASVAAVVTEGRTTSRIWLHGGGSVLVHGEASEVANTIDNVVPEGY